MRCGGLLLCLMALFGLGFAPAPFPRVGRTAKMDDLERLQGIWRMTAQEAGGSPTPHDYKVRVRGDRWTFINLDGNRETDGRGYYLRLDQSVSPRAFELTFDKEGNGGYVGSYRLEGNRLVIICAGGTLKNNLDSRPTDFEGRVQHKMAFEYVGR